MSIENIVWNDKYRFKEEGDIDTTLIRTVEGVYKNDPSNEALMKAKAAVLARDFCPAGRIIAGAGTDRKVTLVNCYVNATIEDSMRTDNTDKSLGIMEAQNVAAFSLQMGGGIGSDFSTIRPDGSLVKRTGSVSSGVLPFMFMWNSMSKTIRSSGSRRGAMMGTLRCDHPDIEAFIDAKHEEGVLTQFNVSVLVTDNFMDAVREDRMWDLGFRIPRADGDHVDEYLRNDEPLYVYKRLPARELWNKIIKSTYEYAEPGVIFIDRINKMNNLHYCETISCTNPCGEQTLPPYGACVLGHINLANMVKNAFTEESDIDFDRLERAVEVGVRLLDNVIVETLYPVPEMREEAENKRRIGLGVMGLANMLQMMELRYGSDKAVNVTKVIMEYIRNVAYMASVKLAKERGPFPLYDRDAFHVGKFIQDLPDSIKEDIFNHGIRNGVLLTIAPTGTTSLLYGNVSGGVEPTFAWSYERKVIRDSGETETFDVEDYGYKLFKNQWKTTPDSWIEHRNDVDAMPDYMVTAQDLDVMDHLKIQAACQEFVDASISKTINCPTDMTLLDFKEVYTQAYEMGCKGCTTYRPNPEMEKIRGSVISVKKDDIEHPSGSMSGGITWIPEPEEPTKRPHDISGSTYKVKWPLSDHAYYVTINNHQLEGSALQTPFEIFINSKDMQHQEWITALTLTLSAIFRKGGDITFIPEQLKSTVGQGAWIDGKYVPGLVSLIGDVITEHYIKLGIITDPIEAAKDMIKETPNLPKNLELARTCPQCSAPALIFQEGCDTCLSCGYSKCS